MAEEKKHKAGVPKGAIHADKKTYDPLKLIEKIADNAAKKTPIPPTEITAKDKAVLKHISGMSVEQFNEHLSAKLRKIADELADEILARKSEIGANNLAFTLAVAADKLARLDGSSKLAGASVNVQVNNYGPVDRDTLIAQLTGKKPILPVQPLAPTPPPTAPTKSHLDQISPPTQDTDTVIDQQGESLDKPLPEQDSNDQAQT